jgi:hypothetical protein
LLFLGLGTGLGSAMVVDGIVQPMELGHLPYRKGRTYEDYLGLRGLKRLGKKRWGHQVLLVIEKLQAALEPDDVVIGGGNAKRLTEVPMGCRLGDNANAFVGGFKLWKGGCQLSSGMVDPIRISSSPCALPTSLQARAPRLPWICDVSSVVMIASSEMGVSRVFQNTSAERVGINLRRIPSTIIRNILSE